MVRYFHAFYKHRYGAHINIRRLKLLSCGLYCSIRELRGTFLTSVKDPAATILAI